MHNLHSNLVPSLGLPAWLKYHWLLVVTGFPQGDPWTSMHSHTTLQCVLLVTVFILEQVPAGSMSEASKYQVLEAPFWRWFCNFPMPFRDGTGTLSVTASDSSHALPTLGSIRSIRKSSYFTFLTSNLWLLLFSGFITYILQGTSPHIADDIRQVYLCPYTYTCLFSHRHLSCFNHLG